MQILRCSRGDRHIKRVGLGQHLPLQALPLLMVAAVQAHDAHLGSEGMWCTVGSRADTQAMAWRAEP